jgi:tRNA A37 threonylcarbamoyladenosine dehydratase
MIPGSPPGRFSRTIDLYGGAGFARIREAKVAVVGLGGVGAHAALALARSGVGGLRLCDFDRLSVSSLNRHPSAIPGDIGRYKTEVIAETVARTCPDTEVEERREFVDAQTVRAVLDSPVALVVDAIDSLGPKVSLLVHCVRSGLPVVSSMGASSRRGIAGIRVGDLGDSSHCPLARHVRRRLRALGASGGVLCVYSVEPPLPPLPPDPDDPGLPRGRRRKRQPSGVCLPGIFGYALAATVLERLAAEPNPG